MKTTFLLHDINIDSIDEKYNFKFKSNINRNTHKQNTTDLNDLSDIENNKSYSYLDDSKKKKKCIVSMCNMIGKNLPKQTNIHCYWCKHSFNTKPISCPIKYVHRPKEHYICDGIFCSFNCCLAFINDNQHLPLYEYSYNLLKHIHSKIFDINTFIKPSPNWRLLNVFGGNKSIEEFRKTFDSIIYEDIDNYITNIPDQLPIGWLYKESIYL